MIDQLSGLYRYFTELFAKFKSFEYIEALLAVMNITELVLEIRPEKKIQACTGLEPMTFAIPVEHSTTELTSQLGANRCVGSK